MFKEIKCCKRCSTFLMSIFLIAALVFSTPITIFAQQDAEVPAAKATIEPDKLLVIMAAARVDAERDVNELKWIAGSCLGGTIGIAGIGGLAIVHVAEGISSSCSGGAPLTPLIGPLFYSHSAVALHCLVYLLFMLHLLHSLPLPNGSWANHLSTFRLTPLLT